MDRRIKIDMHKESKSRKGAVVTYTFHFSYTIKVVTV